MKIVNTLLPVALLALGVGCRSSESSTVSRTSTTPQTMHAVSSQQNEPPSVVQQELKPTTIEQFTTDKATYTVETIPNPRLTPTSREGDMETTVYSSNIIGVFVHTNNSMTVNSTNTVGTPAPANNPPPETK
jgi:hypothetical protein